jgi:alcohol dehydrogenase class IV
MIKSQAVISTYLWPGQTHFGFGAVDLLGREGQSLSARRVFILADPGVIAANLLAPITASLEAAKLPYVIYDRVEANPSIASVDAAAAAFRESGADLLVGVGGGSSLDTAKAVKLLAGGPAKASIWEYALMLGEERRPYPRSTQMPPYIAIPTTAGTGAEVTPWAVITHPEKQLKFGIGNHLTIPNTALVDPQLTLTLSPRLTAATGMDALAHLIEAYVSTNHNPILDPMILYGIELIGRNVRTTVTNGSDRAARQAMLQASLIGGIAISSKWLGACHSLAHPLSSLAHLHHGLACAMMLPHQMAYSLSGAPEKYAAVGRALDSAHAPDGDIDQQAQHAVEAVQALSADLGLPARLREVDVTEAMLPQLARAAYADLNWGTNPRSVSEAVMEQLYRQAF